jgi:thermolysin
MKFGPLSIVLLLMSSTAVWAAPANDRAGFAALHGAAAANFQLPGDVRFMHSRALRGGQLTANRYQQRVGSANVLGGQLTVLKSANGDVTAVIGAHYPGLLSTNDIVLKAPAAQGIAASKIGGAGQWRTQLMINPADGRYFYLVESRRADSRWFHWIDAEDGSLINAYDGLTTGSGIGVRGDTKDLTGLTTQSGNTYEMISSDGRQTTYDAGGKSRLPGRLATDDNDIWNTPGRTSPGQAALVDAHFYANVTDEYLLDRGFDWLAHFPQGMVSSAHVKRNYNNAYWNGSQMAYGDGDGSTFVELSGDLDVVAHELSHGVTDATSDLIYQNESGALNEAFSDIMGTSVEYFYGSGNWTIGEDITPGDNGIRNMANPGEDGDPSHYDERYTGTADNGGVHWNSGIANHWYYLLVNGGQNADASYASDSPVTGIGMTAAEQIAFDGFTALNATADFCAARASTMAVAGQNDVNVGDAWDEVGVDDALCSGGGGGGGGGGGTGGGDGPVISKVSSEKLRGVKFRISWDTNVASTTEVIFTCCGTYTKTQLVTSHSYDFNGSKGTTYEYYVASEDANGNRSEEGPFTHQN